MRRGEVWRVQQLVSRPSESRRLICSANAINDVPDRGTFLTLKVFDSDPGGLLAVNIGYGWASALWPETTPRRLLTEKVGDVDPELMDQVSTAIRAAWDVSQR